MQAEPKVSPEGMNDAALRKLWKDLPGAFVGFALGADGAMDFRFVSDSAANVYGIDPLDIRLNPTLLYDRILPEDLHRLAQMMRVSVTTMHSAQVRMRYEHPSKGQRWLETWYTPSISDEGSLQWIGWTQDVTDRRNADVQAASMRETVEAGADPVYCCAPDGRLLFANRAARARIDAGPGDFTPIDNLIQELLPVDWEELRERAMREGAAFFTARDVSDAGDLQELEGWVSRGMLEGREALWVFARDVTERSRDEERQRLHSALFDATLAGTIIMDPEARIVDVNPAYLRMTGFSREDLIGVDSTTMVPESRRNEETALMTERLFADGTWYGEYERICKDGSVAPNLLTLSLVRDDRGEISHILSVSSDISELKAQQQRLEQLAHFDALTALPNRVLFADRLQQALAHSRRSGTVLAVCYLDLDGFKPINDGHGHGVGDALLVAIAERLRASVRATDTVARIGGDEFALLITDIGDPEHGARMLRELLAEVSRPARIAGIDLAVSASIGATFFPTDDADAETLLRHADEAMYQAKRSGRSCFTLFDAELERRLGSNQRLRSEFESALAGGELKLRYEPKIDLRHEVVVGAEALIRWQHPQRGLLEPADFLPMIEDTDLVVALGEWVMIELRRQLEAWEALGYKLPVSLNIAARHLRKSDFPARLEQLLGTFCASRPGRIELEIVETAALGDIDAIAETMRRCSAMGVGFALDDFGTGYSSLSWLRKLPADTIKIDRSFVGDILGDLEDRTLVGGLIGLARRFGRQVVAEGVETAKHSRLLLDLGCEYGQGYHFTRPLEGGELLAWIAEFEAKGIGENPGASG